MKFPSLPLITTLTSLLATTTTASSFPSTYTLVADGGWTVVTDGTHLYIGTGDIQHYPILILKGGSNNTAITGHKQYDTTTGTQHLYVLEDQTKPIGLTDPNDAAAAGASVTGFGVDEDNYLLLNGEEAWGVQPREGQVRRIYWLGGDDIDDADGEFEGIGLWVKECRGC
ncbi:hypothetical protein AbraIFM66951_002238 [Aspergillus brasiliensis]|uniref:Uncharacterized protein n=1 Tax=Aspergillus brasiliensis TaxID=319629 RepID=A0A9W6DSP5_9EURO|nr:hypothetical protein AbraCBS73388_002414 [Aspergillus brasiliensis]GKZ49667.1 hypothetical protein AbraIFM66951_002238 [Aspergillus brasiliensis]